jgi:hypothetical protein
MKITHWVIIGIIISSCSPAAKLRRAENLIKKAEEQGAVWTVDSIRVEVPVFVPETRVDSVFVSKPGDTVTLIQDRLKVKYVRLPGDSVFIEGKCESDTIKIKQTVTINKTIKAQGWLRWWHLLIAAGVGLLIGIFKR